MELSLVLENHSDTLHRFTGLLYRRGYTVNQLSVTPDNACLKINAHIDCDTREGEHLFRLLSAKMLDVVDAQIEPVA